MGGVEKETAFMGLFFDFLARHNRRQRQASAKGLGQTHDIGRNAIALEGKHGAGPTDAGLGFIEDEQTCRALHIFFSELPDSRAAIR